MAKYRRLTLELRYQIDALKRSNEGVRSIARTLGLSASVVSRELRRNRKSHLLYDARYAQESYRVRMKWRKRKAQKMTDKLESYVSERIRRKWSPEQISGRMKLDRETASLSHETIYRYIYRDAAKCGDLWKHLRHRKKSRYSRAKRKALKRCGNPLNRKYIEERPQIVETRSRAGDYERDTMETRRGKSVIFTIVDRKLRFTKLIKIAEKSASCVHKATIDLLKGLAIKTITNDNGTEFSMSPLTEKALNIPIYYCKPHRPCDRGTVENTNGLLRQYFPRRQSFDQYSEEYLKAVEDELNNRPRKCLGFRTPLELQE